MIVLPAAPMSRDAQNGQHTAIAGIGSAGNGVPGSREREKDMGARWEEELNSGRLNEIGAPQVQASYVPSAPDVCSLLHTRGRRAGRAGRSGGERGQAGRSGAAGGAVQRPAANRT